MSSREIKEEERQALQELGDMKGRSSEHVLALDGIAVIVAPSSPLNFIQKKDLTGIFCGNTTDWSELKSGHGSINVYIRDENSGTHDTFKTLVCGNKPFVTSTKKFEDSAELEAAVSRDPTGIGFIGLPYVKTAKAVSVADGNATPFAATTMTVKKENYALSRRLYLYTSAASKNSYVDQFVAYSLSSQGQSVVKSTGFIDLIPNVSNAASLADGKPSESMPSTCLLSKHWRYGSKNQYCETTQSSKDLQVSFRFRSGSAELDNRAWRDVRRVLKALEDQASGKEIQITLIGFADSQGSYETNKKLSEDRARTIQKSMNEVGLTNITTIGYGQEIPVADNSTEEGREKNRRVEVWVH